MQLINAHLLWGVQTILLRWEVDDDPGTVLTFSVYRSGSQHGNWSLIGTSLSPTYEDRFTPGAKFDPVYYYIECEGVKSEVITVYDAPDIDTQVLAGRVRYQIARHNGNPAFLYQRRQFGPRCPDCFRAGQGSTNPQCPTCYGTGFEAGYWPGVPIYAARFQPSTEQGVMSQTQNIQAGSETLWVGHTVIVHAEDVIIEENVSRDGWIVQKNVTRSERYHHPISQRFDVNQIDRGHVLYRLPRPAFSFPPRKSIYRGYNNGDPKGFDAQWRERLDAYAATLPVIDLRPPAPKAQKNFDGVSR